MDGARGRRRSLRRDEDALTRLVRRSVEIKAEVVSGDERETGRRAILNAGHTVAHALEQARGYRSPTARPSLSGWWPSARWPKRLGDGAERDTRRASASLLERLGLPVRLAQRAAAGARFWRRCGATRRIA